MKALTRYIFSQVLAATVFVTLALTFAIWLTQSLRFIDYIVNRGLPASTFLAFVGLLLPSFLGIVLPIATFVAVLFIYHKLAMDSEMVVLRAAGLSQMQLARPALIMSLLATLVVFTISLYFLPASFREFKDLQHRLRSDVSTVLLQEGVFNNIKDGLTVYLRKRTGDGQMRGILVHDTRDKARRVTMMAESGALVINDQGPRVVMKNGNRQELDRETNRISILYFDSYTFELAGFGQAAGPRWREPKERYLHELLNPTDSRDDVRHRAELIAEGHQRIVSPLYTLAFALIGLAALLSGEFNRRGQIKRVVIAIACVAALEAASLALHDLASRTPQAIPVMYASALIPLLASLLLLLRTPRRKKALRQLAEAGAQ